MGNNYDIDWSRYAVSGNIKIELYKSGSYVNTIISSTDNNLDKGKKLNTDVWYEVESLNWVKATFNKKGKWEYRLINIE